MAVVSSAGSANTTSLINTYRVITAIYSQSSSGNSYMYTNGTQESFYAGGGYNIFPGSGQIQLGGRTWDGNTGRLFKGDLGEVLVYNRMLTADEISTISNWLRAKWGF